MSDGDDLPGETLDDIAFLVRSENRVQVLDALTAEVTAPGRPTPSHPRRDLQETTGTSRTTLSRIISEFEDRGWVDRTVDGEYVATPRAQHIAAEFEPFINAIETIRNLGDAVGLLPASELSIGPEDGVSIGRHHFQNATVREPATWDPTDVSRYYSNLLEDASTFRWVVYIGPSGEITDMVREGIHSGQLTAEGVFTGSILDRFQETPELGPEAHDVESEYLRIFRYTDHIPCNLWVVDETVVIENSQVEGIAPGTIIESQNAAIRQWAMAVIDRYIAESTEVHPEEFSD